MLAKQVRGVLNACRASTPQHGVQQREEHKVQEHEVPPTSQVVQLWAGFVPVGTAATSLVDLAPGALVPAISN